jgi:glycerol kinase
MKKYILALDQGTTSSRGFVFDVSKGGELVSSCSKEFKQIFPADGWVEHDPFDILSSQLYAAKEAISRANISADEIGINFVSHCPLKLRYIVLEQVVCFYLRIYSEE